MKGHDEIEDKPLPDWIKRPQRPAGVPETLGLDDDSLARRDALREHAVETHTCSRCGEVWYGGRGATHHCPPARLVYGIRNAEDSSLFWSRQHGWVGNEEYEDLATYTASEQASEKLPPRGQWVCGECGQGDPAEPRHICR